VIRGDLEVNEAKLCAAAGISALVPATAEQIAAAGATAGYASPVGLNILDGSVVNGPSSAVGSHGPLTADHEQSGVFRISDRSIVEGGPLVAGANRAGYHMRNVVYGRDWRATLVADIAAVRTGDPCVRCGTALRFERGVEIGHIFKLGTRYTEVLG